jgi:hypothetical protein
VVATGGRRAEEAAATRKKPPQSVDDYARRWLATRTVKGRPGPHRRALPVDARRPPRADVGSKAVRDITMQAVDRWYTKTLADKPTMRAHCYSLLRAI